MPSTNELLSRLGLRTLLKAAIVAFKRLFAITIGRQEDFKLPARPDLMGRRRSNGALKRPMIKLGSSDAMDPASGASEVVGHGDEDERT